MEYEIQRKDGRVIGVMSPIGFHYKGEDNPAWMKFLEWNKEHQLDVEDKTPEPPPRDVEKEAIIALLDKDGSGTIAPAEKLDFCFKVCKRIARGL